MRAARITLVVVLLLLAASLLSSSSGGEQAAVPGAVKVPGVSTAPQVRVRLDAERRRVRVPPGSVVRLTVASERSDEARVAELGLDWPVGPDIDSEVEFVAPAAAGRFAVVLRDTGERAGTLVVGAR